MYKVMMIYIIFSITYRWVFIGSKRSPLRAMGLWDPWAIWTAWPLGPLPMGHMGPQGHMYPFGQWALVSPH